MVALQSVRASFITNSPPLGNLSPEPAPFDLNAWDNRAYPQFTWTASARNQMLVDPSTGLLVKRMTFAGDAYAKSQTSTDGSGSQLANAVVASGSCSHQAGLNASGSQYGTWTGAPTVLLPLTDFQMT